MITKLLLLFTVFLIPLLGNFNGFGYEQIKIAFFILSISLIAFVWLFQRPDVKLTGIGKTAAVFILILFLSSLEGLDFKTSFLGNPPYFQGLLIYCYLFLFYLIIKNFHIEFKYYCLSLTASALIVSLRAIQDFLLQNIFNMEVPNYAGRVVSSFGQPNFFAGFLLLTLPFSYYLYKTYRGKISYLGLFTGFVSIAGIFVSYSRVALGLLVVLVFLWLFGKLSQFKFEIVGIILVVIAASVFISLKYSTGLPYKELVLVQDKQWILENAPEKRIHIFSASFKLALNKPLTGYGLENINQGFSDYFTKNKHILFEENLKIEPALISLKDLNIDRTHNYILDLALFSGIFGIFSWLLLVFLLLKKLLLSEVSLENNILWLGLITYLVWVQFQNQSIVHLLYFWFLAGAIDKGMD